MSEEVAIAAFRAALRRAFEDFQADEQRIRGQYARAVQEGEAPAGADDDELLERPTRRFLVDRMLRSLDWNPDDPRQVMEEARSWDADDERLYFDYLGIAPETRAPVVLVEAKAYDVGAARQPRGQNLDARGMADLISGAIGDLKSGRKDRPILAEWAEWLNDLRTYVRSLDELGRSTLRRVVSTAGRWVVIFEEPVDVFTGEGPPNVGLIHCFVSLEDILNGHAALFRLLHRPRLVDTLPLSLSPAQALAVLNPTAISRIFRGVVAVTRESGGSRRTYPTRSIWPAIIAITSDRPFAIIDDAGAALEDPREPGRMAEFIGTLSANGAAFEARLLQMLGRPDLVPGPMTEFPGFPRGLGSRKAAQPDVVPIAGSTPADALEGGANDVKFVIHVGGPYPEYVIATGEHWFFKTAEPVGPACEFHEWPKARAKGVAAAQPLTGHSETSYTQSGDDIHCAHEELRGLRAARCKIAVLESHLCCRACRFNSICWAEDAERLPCPA